MPTSTRRPIFDCLLDIQAKGFSLVSICLCAFLAVAQPPLDAGVQFYQGSESRIVARKR
jgi:hypothetical protein